MTDELRFTRIAKSSRTVSPRMTSPMVARSSAKARTIARRHGTTVSSGWASCSPRTNACAWVQSRSGVNPWAQTSAETSASAVTGYAMDGYGIATAISSADAGRQPVTEVAAGRSTTELPAAIDLPSHCEHFGTFSWRLNKRLGSSIKSNIFSYFQMKHLAQKNVRSPRLGLPLRFGSHLNEFLSRFYASMELPLRFGGYLRNFLSSLG